MPTGEKDFAPMSRGSQILAMTIEEAHAAIAEAERVGFDLSLVDSNLALSVEERLLRHDAALEFKLALRAAGEAMYAQAAQAAATSR
ncbi:MAG: hypothetical protein FJ399_23965 [Verrucomicrobia bacterium]|nr:hypothetical protein [Verrucomicrobiota bacterium]